MRVLRVSRYAVSRDALDEAVAVLRSGGVVAFPTETSYGLAADPRQPKAVRRVFAVKNRPPEKRLPLIAGSFAQARQTARLVGAAARLARERWPGPLTLVLPGRSSSAETVAVRVPASAWARRLALAFGHPITSTSANLSGQPALYSGAAVRRTFINRRHRPDLVLDVGQLQPRPPSVIVAVRRGKMEVLRGKCRRSISAASKKR